MFGTGTYGDLTYAQLPQLAWTAALAAVDGADSAAASIELYTTAALAAIDGADSMSAFIEFDIGVILAAVDGADSASFDVAVTPANIRMKPIRDWWDYDEGGNIVPGFCIRNT